MKGSFPVKFMDDDDAAADDNNNNSIQQAILHTCIVNSHGDVPSMFNYNRVLVASVKEMED
jgi:hypothetical protein